MQQVLKTKADLPFALDMLSYRVLFVLDDDGNHVLATCKELPQLRVRSPAIDQAVREV